MKRGITAVFGVVVVACVGILVVLAGEKLFMDNSVTGKELFTDEFVESVISINFRPFDESGVITIKDKEKVNEFFEILRNEKYKSIDESDWVEGSYQFDFVTNNGSEDFGISGDVIIFGGSQRRAVSGNDLVQGIIRDTIH